MLEIVFNVLEGDFNVDLHMFYHSHICSATVSTHRSRGPSSHDISKGNVLYIEEQTIPPADAGCGLQNTEPKEVPLCFVKYLVEERCVIN